MTIVSVEEVGQTRQRATPDGDHAVIRLLVMSDINKERAATALHPPNVFNIQVPVEGDQLDDITGISNDANLVCTSVTAARDLRFFKRWIVTAIYGSGEFARDAAKRLPWERTPVIRYPFASSIEPVYFDVNGDALVTTAGIPLDPPIERQVSIPAVVITQFQRTLDYNTLVTYQDVVNEDTWPVPGNVGTVSAKQAKVVRIEPERLWHDNDLQYFRVTYEIHMREKGWKVPRINEGRQKRTGNVGPPCWDAITDSNGIPVVEPVPLDELGFPFSSCTATPIITMHEILIPKTFDGIIPGPRG